MAAVFKSWTVLSVDCIAVSGCKAGRGATLRVQLQVKGMSGLKSDRKDVNL